MSKKENQPQENTSHISNVVYEIENMKAKGMSTEEIKNYIKYLKKNGDENGIKFPENLELVETFFDEGYSIGACAFLDTNTGETIVGFAGTNSDNDHFFGDLLADAKLGVGGGFNENSPYMKKLNEFMKGLQDKGYNVTQTTGHSLGGALAIYAAIFHNIPYSTTYNGAPLFSYAMSRADMATILASGFFQQMINYDGEIIRFVSESDPLNAVADFFWAKYLGKEYTIKNGEGHAMIEFLNAAEQEYLLSVLLSEGTNNVNNLAVSFGEKGTFELKLSDLTVKNLWGEGGKYSGTITIDPEAFRNLKTNLIENMAETEITWIKQGIELCREKNNTLKDNQENREEDLAKGVIAGLEESGLTNLLNRIEESHGELTTNKQVLADLGDFNKEVIFEKLSGSKRWLLNGEHVTKGDITGWINNVQKAADCLYFETTETGEFDEYIYRTHAREPLYVPHTISSIAKAYKKLADSLLDRTEKVFEGKGKRVGKPDGIPDAIAQVLDVEDSNVDELKKQIITMGEIAGGIAENFSEMDQYLSGAMQSGQAGSYEFMTLPSSYEACLEEDKILSDVVDIIEAYDLQVEQAAEDLAKEIVCDFENLINITRSKMTKIYDVILDFKEAINHLNGKMKAKVTTIELGETVVHGYNDYTTEEIKKSHGMLQDFFTQATRDDIAQAKEVILPVIDSLDYVGTCLEIYRNGLYDIKGYFASIIEKAVYDHYDLDEIINAQKLITAKTIVIMEELKKNNNEIEGEFKGKSMDKYQVQLDTTVTALEYFNRLIRNCFGNNL